MICVDGIQIALDIAKRERVQGSWVSAEGQALNSLPILVFYNGCQKNVPFIERFFQQPLIPAFRISGLIFEKRYKTFWVLNGWINLNERHLARIQSAALDLDILWYLLAYKKYQDVPV